MSRRVLLIILSQFIVVTFCYNYLEESPVKILSVRSVASRFPASNSEFRTNVENGYDEDVERTQAEELNGFPPKKLTLQPGGCAFYQIPVNPGENNSFIQPAKTKGDYYWDYCNKAPLIVDISSLDDNKLTSFNCFDSSIDPCSSKACQASISSVVDEEVASVVKVKVCVEADSTHNGAVWEINFSSSNESNKLEGFFVEAARDRLRQLEFTPEFNTQLSFVSIVGGRGVGKSTVASLLSGNSTMFEIGSASIGTTTTGADMSAVIPSIEWATILESKLGGLTVNLPSANFPMFLVDSEGMGVRGDSFDFMTTSPPAIIAKLVIWIGAENVQTVKILNEIDSYLNGLDNIVMNQTIKAGDICPEPFYGHFVIIINKMMGGATDNQLYAELMSPEPDYIEGSEERNAIRRKMQQCFAGISVHGLPLLQIPDGQHVDYPLLSGRFKDGIAAVANTIVERLDIPWVVTVAGSAMELIATNAEVIIGTVIEEANNGKIDLNGFSSFWTFVKQQVNATIGASEPELNAVAPACGGVTQQPGGLTCTLCVCDYRTKVISRTLEKVAQVLDSAKIQANALFNSDLQPFIDEFMKEVVNVWLDAHSCKSSKSATKKPQGQICDLTAINMKTPGQPIHMTCNLLFTCGEVIGDASEIVIETDGVYIGEGATIKNVVPAKAANGANGVAAGESGQDGRPGLGAFNMKITANKLLSNSAQNIIFITKGGEGGNGGNGVAGKYNMDVIPSEPTSAKEAYERGYYINYVEDCWDDCSWHCEACEKTWFHEFIIDVPNAACGGNGGNGGNGGDAGSPGLLIIEGPSELTVSNTQLDSIGGMPGVGASGAVGLIVHRKFTGFYRIRESVKCGLWDTYCDSKDSNDWYDGWSRAASDKDCPGKPGTAGKPGLNKP